MQRWAAGCCTRADARGASPLTSCLTVSTGRPCDASHLPSARFCGITCMQGQEDEAGEGWQGQVGEVRLNEAYCKAGRLGVVVWWVRSEQRAVANGLGRKPQGPSRRHVRLQGCRYRCGCQWGCSP